MKLTTVLGSVNSNPDYYLFIPKQIYFWRKFGIRFIAVFVGSQLPEVLRPYSDHIFLWNTDLDLNHAYVAQNLRMYFASQLELPDDELVMITDMDMLPMNGDYYKRDLEQYEKKDFIHYRTIPYHERQIYMCYNAAHPHTWSEVFQVKSREDISARIREHYQANYTGVPGDTGWYIDQEVMYKYVIPYPHLKELRRELRRLETWIWDSYFQSGVDQFIQWYDDGHFHRSYSGNIHRIEHVQRQLDAQFDQ